MNELLMMWLNASDVAMKVLCAFGCWLCVVEVLLISGEE